MLYEIQNIILEEFEIWDIDRKCIHNDIRKLLWPKNFEKSYLRWVGKWAEEVADWFESREGVINNHGLPLIYRWKIHIVILFSK